MQQRVKKAAAPALSREIKSGGADGADWMPAEEEKERKVLPKESEQKSFGDTCKKKPQIN